MTIPRPDNVGFYAVAKSSHSGKVLVATGPHDAADAHRLVDAEVRPEARARGDRLPAFLDFGVLRIVAKPDGTLPVYTIADGRMPV